MAVERGGGCCPPIDLMRSEPMQLVQLIIPLESSRLTVFYLGQLGLIQFKDLNAEKSPFQRTYANQIKKCGEMARRLRYFKEQMSNAGISIPPMSFSRGDLKVDDLEAKLLELEAELAEMNTNNDKLQHTYNELAEYKLVLQKDNSADASKTVQLGFLTGLVPREKSMAFEKILFRATRGNVFVRQSTVEHPVLDPASGEKVEKNVFVIFYSEERAKNKILKICDGIWRQSLPFQ